MEKEEVTRARNVAERRNVKGKRTNSIIPCCPRIWNGNQPYVMCCHKIDHRRDFNSFLFF